MNDERKTIEVDEEMWRQKRRAIIRLQSVNGQLVDALQDLIDVQNGPPMAKYKQAWEDAMAKAGSALIAAKSGDV